MFWNFSKRICAEVTLFEIFFDKIANEFLSERRRLQKSHANIVKAFDGWERISDFAHGHSKRRSRNKKTHFNASTDTVFNRAFQHHAALTDFDSNIKVELTMLEHSNLQVDFAPAVLPAIFIGSRDFIGHIFLSLRIGAN
jgi:hypothetical protein